MRPLTAPLLELTNAVVMLGATRALDGLTLTIPLGQHTAILGPNGAGKSTLMRVLMLEQRPLLSEDGRASVRVFGQERWDVFALRSQLGIVSADWHERFVRGNANGAVTALDAVVSGFFATLGTFAHQRVSQPMRQRAYDALERVDAGQFATAMLNTLSTGEARRVLIARALVHNPSALLLDEPTRGLDLVSRHRFLEHIRVLARQGTTLLLVTHHVDEVIPEIERVVLLKSGRVAADGATADVLTSTRLGEAFGTPLTVEPSGGYFHVRCRETP
jgi:iron complex transport system ATP-binding protein